MTILNQNKLRENALNHTMFMRTPKEDLHEFAPYILSHAEGVRVTDVDG